jgi:CelD/BcsL family acetyltransferase involved in cellulose biosynthesis
MPGAISFVERIAMPAVDKCEEIGAVVEIALESLPAHGELEGEWRDLEQRTDGSFFVGWSWIGCWLASLGGAVGLSLLRATSGGRTVGLGLIARSRERRHGLITSHSLRLHATGRTEFDTLRVECNGFLVDRQLGELVIRRMLDYLVSVDRTWDEIVLDGLWRVPPWPLAGGQRLRRVVRAEVNHHVDLAGVRTRNGDYLGLLGSKTRAHIRRSCKEYEKLGAIRVRPATDATEALAYLNGLKTLHQSYWVARGQPGAFANPFFDQFHRRLVRDAFGRGEIQLLAIDVDGRQIGYIYNFVYRGRVYNYQTGFDYNLCETQNRPGLVSHACAIEFNAKCGHTVYDFLAGDLEYKQALGTEVAAMYWVILQRGRLRFMFEDAMRAMRNRLRGRHAAPLVRSASALEDAAIV